MRNVNLPTDTLRAFISVIDLGGFTRAADALGRTQPAISLQMRRLVLPHLAVYGLQLPDHALLLRAQRFRGGRCLGPFGSGQRLAQLLTGGRDLDPGRLGDADGT